MVMCRIVFGSTDAVFFSAKEIKDAIIPTNMKNRTTRTMINPSIEANMYLKKLFISLMLKVFQFQIFTIEFDIGEMSDPIPQDDQARSVWQQCGLSECACDRKGKSQHQNPLLIKSMEYLYNISSSMRFTLSGLFSLITFASRLFREKYKRHLGPYVRVEPTEKPLIHRVAEDFFQHFITIVSGAKPITMGQVKLLSQ